MEIILKVSQTRVLCVTISYDISWNAHVDEIVSKARKRVYNYEILVSTTIILFLYMYL